MLWHHCANHTETLMTLNHVTDETEASRLPTYGQRKSSACSSFSFPYLPPHQKETPVSVHTHTRKKKTSLSEAVNTNALSRFVLQGGHRGVDGHSGGVAVQEQWGVSVDGAVPGWARGTRDHQVSVLHFLNWVDAWSSCIHTKPKGKYMYFYMYLPFGFCTHIFSKCVMGNFNIAEQNQIPTLPPT